MTVLRIFSYLPNPRIWKATIAARLAGLDVEVRGASPTELAGWLWDFDARPLTGEEPEDSADVGVGKVGFQGKLRKTAAFLEAHPFGTVPAAFSPDGTVGIFESNSIMRAVARIATEQLALYGRDPYEASRIDSFLDASLVFARDSQIYLLSLMNGTVTREIHARAADGFATWASGIDRALANDRRWLVGDGLTLADICFVAELALFYNETARRNALDAKSLAPILDDARLANAYPRAITHFTLLRSHPAFAPDVEPYLTKLGV
jgi:elongation factor 1-gamma